MLEMLKPVLKNLFSTPATRLYPFEVRDQFPNVRGDLEVDIDSCIYCVICEKKCPSACISVDRNDAKWEVNPYSCVLCGVCVDICPKKALHMHSAWRKPAYDKDNYVVIGQPREKQGQVG